MTSLPRAFLAVFPPADVVDAMAARLAPLPALPAGGSVRFLPREQWHCTLRFCGRVPEVDALVGAVGDALAGLGPVAGLQLAGAGAFPRDRHGSVLWVGMAEGDARSALERVAGAAERACAAAGLPPDDRPFHPHVTVARSARARDLRSLVDAFGPEPVGPPWTAGEVRLVASDTRATGAVHADVAAFALSG